MVYMSFPWSATNTRAAPANVYGELIDCSERKFNFNLNKAGTISFKQNLTSRTATLLPANKEGLILLYYKGTLMQTAQITSVEVVGDDQGNHSVACLATEVMYPRLAGTVIDQDGPTSATDQGTWITGLLNSLNLGATPGIQSGSVTASGNITGGTWVYASILDILQQLSQSTNGFDFWQTPLDPRTSSGNYMAQLNIAPLKGTTKSNVAFEYGTGRQNAKGYDWIIDSSQLSNACYVFGPDWTHSNQTEFASAADNTSTALRGTITSVTQTQLTAQPQIFALVNDIVAVRKKPREIFKIDPASDDGSGRVPVFGVDFTTGDTIRGRVKDQGVLLLDANVRVYGAEINIVDEGMPTTTLTLVNEA